MILDIVLSDGNGPVTNRHANGHTIIKDNTIESLRMAHQLGNTPGGDLMLPSAPTPPLQIRSSGTRTGSKARLSYQQIMQLAQKEAIQSEVEQQMVSSLPSDVQAQVRDSANTHDALVRVIRDGLAILPSEQLVACLQSLNNKIVENNALASRIMELVFENNKMTFEISELTACVIKLQEMLGTKQDEMKGLQLQALDKLALLQNSVRALMTQTYELHEYPIPRLFIVLPHDSSSWNPLDLLSNNFRLYFLCECGEHTKSINSKIPHHIHVAKHEGYDIARPKEFFRQYGSYVLTILRMLKYGVAAAGVATPALSQLVRVDSIDQATAGMKALTNNIEPGMNQVISFIEKVSEDEGEVVQGLSEQMANNEALEGADLRQLETFLRNKDANRVLGNLYRTVNAEGHVKWVCIDHYRENYLMKAAKAFRDTAEVLGGSFDESIGRVKVTLQSRVQAEQFYHALEKVKAVYELEVFLCWGTTQNDFKGLRDALAKTNVGILLLTMLDTDGPTSDILNRNLRYDPIFDIMRLPFIRSVTINNTPKDFIKRSSLQSHKDGFPNLRQLAIDVGGLRYDIYGIESLVAKVPDLSSLTFNRDHGHFAQIYNAIAEHQTCPVTFPDRSLRILPPTNKSLQSTTDFKDMADLLKVLGGRVEAVELFGTWLYDSTVANFAKAIDDGSRLKEFILGIPFQKLSQRCIKDLASIVSRSELRKLRINLQNDAKRVHILESIQWEHLRELEIVMNGRDMETRAMRALVDGAEKLPGRIQLEDFSFQSEVDSAPLSMPQGGLLEAFLSSTLLKTFQVGVLMNLEQTLSLLGLIDLSRMQRLCLRPEYFDSTKVEALLECLQHATELRYVGLRAAFIADKQKERMEAKGVQLSTEWPNQVVNLNKTWSKL